MDEKAIRVLVLQQRAIQLLYILLHAVHVLIVVHLPRLKYNALSRIWYLGGLGTAVLSLYVTLNLSVPHEEAAGLTSAEPQVAQDKSQQQEQRKFCYYCKREFPRGWDHHCVFIGASQP
eukprot:136549-Pelagomonas_calceolata.AAC.3